MVGDIDTQFKHNAKRWYMGEPAPSLVSWNSMILALDNYQARIERLEQDMLERRTEIHNLRAYIRSLSKPPMKPEDTWENEGILTHSELDELVKTPVYSIGKPSEEMTRDETSSTE